MSLLASMLLHVVTLRARSTRLLSAQGGVGCVVSAVLGIVSTLALFAFIRKLSTQWLRLRLICRPDLTKTAQPTLERHLFRCIGKGGG